MLSLNDLIDAILSPVILWLTQIYDRLHSLSVPLARPLNLSLYFGYFSVLGPVWTTVVTTIISLSVIYFILFVIMKNIDLILKFKSLIKWW